jgi:hypothetical protein
VLHGQRIWTFLFSFAGTGIYLSSLKLAQARF